MHYDTDSTYGAAETVTGSCHYLQLKQGPQILVDCGMFQGRATKQANDDFGFNPADIDLLLITHAHLDHVGRIPKLVNEGFSGRIVCLRATYDLMQVILMDSAKIMREDYKTDLKKLSVAARKTKSAHRSTPWTMSRRCST